MTVSKALALAIGAVVCAGALGTGCAPGQPAAAPPSPSVASARPGPSAAPAPRPLPGLGPVTRARVPDEARQALVVTGPGEDTFRARAVLYERFPEEGWRAVAGPWPAHNGLRGWSEEHRAGDLRTPVGVFGLSDAGGRLPDPGTRMPYDEDPDFEVTGTGHLGEDLEGSFDYVVAIDYNRVPGTTPLDDTRPMGAELGGGVWLHVDHEGPTNACVSLREEHMRELLLALDPERSPVVVMGPAPVLAS
ncbi:hypothetical protein [Streptomyces tagetis]|uniref:Lipoprotein n=1 Tax=Streptomyces tagetis TaxID=2820809 RepID=A0A940XH19_9ACTN|nr:hypothetical protein [Streptomyces sp. RG38]MBQ0826416.1 hypothetical protein [Streptomyces sp. RG38]